MWNTHTNRRMLSVALLCVLQIGCVITSSAAMASSSWGTTHPNLQPDSGTSLLEAKQRTARTTRTTPTVAFNPYLNPTGRFVKRYNRGRVKSDFIGVFYSWTLAGDSAREVKGVGVKAGVTVDDEPTSRIEGVAKHYTGPHLSARTPVFNPQNHANKKFKTSGRKWIGCRQKKTDPHPIACIDKSSTLASCPPEYRVFFDTWIVVANYHALEKCVHKRCGAPVSQDNPINVIHAQISVADYQARTAAIAALKAGGKKVHPRNLNSAHGGAPGVSGWTEWCDKSCDEVMDDIKHCLKDPKIKVIGPVGPLPTDTKKSRDGEKSNIPSVAPVYAWKFDTDNIPKKSGVCKYKNSLEGMWCGGCGWRWRWGWGCNASWCNMR